MLRPEYNIEDLLADESFIRYCNGTDPDARIAWEQKILENPAIEPVIDDAKKWLTLLSGNQGDLVAETGRLLRRLPEAGTGRLTRRKLGRPRWWMAAAAVILCLLAGEYWAYFNRLHKKNDASWQAQLNNVSHSGAILTLADGSKVALDSMGNRMITKQGDTKVLASNGGVMYKADSRDKHSDIAFNTMTTAAGKQYRLVLPDGTGVWLNSSSTIRFPVQFTGSERKVEISGEAYFEIAPDAHMPFKVAVGNGPEIEVLGTHFNVNAYKDDGITKTTLLEGRIKITDGGQTRTLQPGEQAQVEHTNDGASSQIKVVAVDAESSIAWKNGLFNFQCETIRPIMKELARWYDIKVDFKDGEVNDHFCATLSRSMHLEDVLKRLEMTGSVKFILEDNKVIVSGQ